VKSSASQFQNSCEYPQVSYTVSYKIITLRQLLSQVLCKMGSENAYGCAQNVENGFLGDKFFIHII
jgi:hypothetical protein